MWLHRAAPLLGRHAYVRDYAAARRSDLEISERAGRSEGGGVVGTAESEFPNQGDDTEACTRANRGADDNGSCPHAPEAHRCHVRRIRIHPQRESAESPMAPAVRATNLLLRERPTKEQKMKKVFAYGGIAASIVLVAFGAGAIAIGATGLSDVRNEITAQGITATDDAAELTNGRLQPGQAIKTGADARAFADIMEHHVLESTEGKRYAEMGRFVTPSGGDTSDEALAAKTPDGRPVENGLRNMWVTETALTTALNTAFFAERVALFSIVMGIALLLTGIGFLVLTLGGALGLVALPKRGKKLDPASAAI
jgi:hypothetical protein